MKAYLIFGIFWYVYQRKMVSTKELAEHFEISTRTVYRYIEAISYAGIPIFSKKGSCGGVYIDKSFCFSNINLNKNA